MMKQHSDFNTKTTTQENWYDLREDWGLIESSLAKQYGIRIRQQADMPWTEFCTLVSGLMADTPLGQIVSIRAEKDPKNIKNFSPEQRKIFREWRNKQAEKQLQNTDKLGKDMESLEKILASMFGKKEVKSCQVEQVVSEE